MTTNPKNNRTIHQVADEKLVDGFDKNAQVLSSLFINGTSMSTSAIVALLTTRIDSSNNVALTKAAWQHAVETDRDLRAKTGATVAGVRQGLQVAFADATDKLADYGLKPRKPRVLTPEQKVAAAAKAKATRAARHTMGSKQKAQIKGTVEVPVTAPTASSPVAAAPPAPASPAGPPAAIPPVAAPTATPVAPKPAS